MIAKTTKQGPVKDPRRILLLGLSVALLAGAATISVLGEGGGSVKFAAGAMGRIGLVTGALCLAWPSLRRPARWLPPGIAFAFIVALMVLAAQPRLVVVAIPALAALFSVTAFLRGVRGQK